MTTIKFYKWLIQLRLFIGAWIILLLLVGAGFKMYQRTIEGQCMVRHSIIMDVLREHIDSGGQVPLSRSELAHVLPWVTDEKEKYDLRYYPEAWSKDGRILLRSSALGSYVVSFGSGARAIMSYWRCEPNSLNETNTSEGEYHFIAGGLITFLPVQVFLVILIVAFLILSIIERKIAGRRKTDVCNDSSS